jgi:hypothetical protein
MPAMVMPKRRSLMHFEGKFKDNEELVFFVHEVL